MVTPSVATTVVFSAIVLGIAAAVVWAVRHSGLDRGDSPLKVRHDAVRAAVLVAAYLAATAGVTASGVLARPGPPPALIIFFAVSNLTAVGVALSPLGARFARHLPLWALLGFHSFRLPLELVLHRWYLEGVLPVQMTYEGLNFDIVSGLGGLVLGVWAWRSTPPRALVWAYNLVGLALLVTVATIAVTSSPLPLRQFHEGPPVLLGLHVPYSWIVPFCVAGALAGHLIVFRHLRVRSEKG
jgi:hypothetical protein